LDRTDITNLFIKKEANRKLHMPQVTGNFDDIINSNLGYLVLNKMIPHDIIAKENETLRWNMKVNDIETVIENTNSWKVTMPFDKNKDVLLMEWI